MCDLEHKFKIADLVEQLSELCRSPEIIDSLKNNDDYWQRICENRRLYDEG